MFSTKYFNSNSFSSKHFPARKTVPGGGHETRKKKRTKEITPEDAEGISKLYERTPAVEVLEPPQAIEESILTEIESSKVIDSDRYKEYIELVKQQEQSEAKLSEIQEAQEIALILALIQNHVK